MKHYSLNPALLNGFIPGHGRVRHGQVLTGDYDRFVPGILVELEAMPVVVEQLAPLPPPAPSEPAPEPVVEMDTLSEEAPPAEEDSAPRGKGKRFQKGK